MVYKVVYNTSNEMKTKKKTDEQKSSTTTLKYTKSIKNFRKFNSPKNYYEA